MQADVCALSARRRAAAVVGTINKYPGAQLRYELCYVDSEGAHTIPSGEIRAVKLEATFLEFTAPPRVTCGELGG